MKSQVIFHSEFSCAHFYKVDSWSDQQNRQIFGRCFSEHGHGHDYVLETRWDQSLDPRTESFLKELVELLDHQHLNFKIPEFQNQVPTTENLAQYCLIFLKKKGSNPVSLRLFERPDLWVEVQA